MTAPVLVVVDAPGGPHPSMYLPPLLAEFTVHTVWLDVEPAGPRERRARALAAVERAGGLLVSVGGPQQVPAALADLLERTDADGAVAFSERVVHMTQRAAGAAGLPGNPPGVLDALQDKRLQRAALRAGGLPTPAVVELRTERDVAAAAASCSFAAVLKPSVGMGSVATFRIPAAEALAPAWARGRRLAEADPRIAHLRPVMLLEEEWAGDPGRAIRGLGDYLSVEALVVDGEMHLLAVSDKLPLSHPYRENGHILPALRPAGECAEAVDHVRAAHRALGIRFGATHTEVKLTAEGPRVIEVNGRVGGSVPEQLRLAAGYDLTLNLARLSAGRTPRTDVACDRWSAYLTPQPPEGRHRIDVAPAPETVQALPGMASVHHLTPRDAVVDSADGTASNLVRVVTVHDSPEELFAVAALLAGPETYKLRPERPHDESDRCD